MRRRAEEAFIWCLFFTVDLAKLRMFFEIVVQRLCATIWSALAFIWSFIKPAKEISPLPRTPESVNYHFTRQCNYQCGFCFHTAKTSFVLPIEEAKRGLKMLKEAGIYSRQSHSRSRLKAYTEFPFSLNWLSPSTV